MARPRKSTGGKTSFGKQSDAEKSFYKRKKTKSSDKDFHDKPRKSYSRTEDSDRPSRPSRFTRNSSKSSFRSDEKEGASKRFSRPGFSKKEGDSNKFSRPKFSNKEGDSKKFSRPGFSKKEGDSNKFSRPKFSNKEGDSKMFSRPGFSRKEGDKRSFNPRQPDERFEKKPLTHTKEGFSNRDARKKSFSKSGDEETQPRKSSNYGLPYKRKPFDKAKKYKSTKRIHREERQKTESDLIRLNKFIANSGIGSRREADELIRMGLISVNGETITEMGYKVKPTDEVRYEGRKLKAEKLVYLLLNKPKGFITTTDDPHDRNTVMNLVSNAGNERIYPVGRLDRNTTGLLLLTNDGDLADKLTHPSYNVKKIYKVELDKPISKTDFEKIKEGVYLEEGRATVDDVAIVSDDKKSIGIELHIGWNRIVRRIFESLGYKVEKLDRVVYAGLDKKDLARGQWRFLKPEEIIKLKHFN